MKQNWMKMRFVADEKGLAFEDRMVDVDDDDDPVDGMDPS